jgi:hypothetical protein
VGSLLWVTIAVWLAAITSGCGETDPRAARLARSPLKDSKFAAAILLPESLRLKENVTGPAYAWSGPAGTEAQLWVFKTEATPDELAAHFRRELPGATEGVHPVDAKVPEFVWRPSGAVAAEEVVIDIRPGEVQIRESLLPETAAAWRER